MDLTMTEDERKWFDDGYEEERSFLIGEINHDLQTLDVGELSGVVEWLHNWRRKNTDAP